MNLLMSNIFELHVWIYHCKECKMRVCQKRTIMNYFQNVPKKYCMMSRNYSWNCLGRHLCYYVYFLWCWKHIKYHRKSLFFAKCIQPFMMELVNVKNLKLIVKVSFDWWIYCLYKLYQWCKKKIFFKRKEFLYCLNKLKNLKSRFWSDIFEMFFWRLYAS